MAGCLRKTRLNQAGFQAPSRQTARSISDQKYAFASRSKHIANFVKAFEEEAAAEWLVHRTRHDALSSARNSHYFCVNAKLSGAQSGN
jgi:hypothetical protein